MAARAGIAPGVRVENLTFRRSAKNLLDMDMTVSLSGGTQ